MWRQWSEEDAERKSRCSPVLPTNLLSRWLALERWCISFYPPQRGPAWSGSPTRPTLRRGTRQDRHKGKELREAKPGKPHWLKGEILVTKPNCFPNQNVWFENMSVSNQLPNPLAVGSRDLSISSLGEWAAWRSKWEYLQLPDRRAEGRCKVRLATDVQH